MVDSRAPREGAEPLEDVNLFASLVGFRPRTQHHGTPRQILSVASSRSLSDLVMNVHIYTRTHTLHTCASMSHDRHTHSYPYIEWPRPTHHHSRIAYMSTRITHEHSGDWEHDPHYIVSATTFLVHPRLKTQTAIDYVVSYFSTHMLTLDFCCLLIPNAPYNR